jgi:hypothetical protein
MKSTVQYSTNPLPECLNRFTNYRMTLDLKMIYNKTAEHLMKCLTVKNIFKTAKCKFHKKKFGALTILRGKCPITSLTQSYLNLSTV